MLLFENLLFTKITVLKELFMLNSDPLEFLSYISNRLRDMKESIYIFFNSARPQCEACLADYRLLHVQNVKEWALIKIQSVLFLHQKAEMHDFATKFILHIREGY